jgi:predicted metalloprotease with PDZ domain
MLLADVELRRQSGGARSLDQVLMELSACCGQGSRAWPAAEVGERIDAIAGAPVMRELIANVVRARVFPQLGELFAQLGVDDQGRAKPGAPLAAIRDAIMRAPAPADPSLRAEGSGGTSSTP